MDYDNLTDDEMQELDTDPEDIAARGLVLGANRPDGRPAMPALTVVLALIPTPVHLVTNPVFEALPKDTLRQVPLPCPIESNPTTSSYFSLISISDSVLRPRPFSANSQSSFETNPRRG